VSNDDSGFDLNPFTQCKQYLQVCDTTGALDLIDLTFNFIDKELRRLSAYDGARTGITQDPDSAIRDLNHRLLEHGIGYQFEGGELIVTQKCSQFHV